MPEMAEDFAPSDWRFLGSPVDFIIFDGLHKGAVERIVLVEVKTGKSRLAAEQSQLKAFADSGLLAVDCEVVRMPVQATSARERPLRRVRRGG